MGPQVGETSGEHATAGPAISRAATWLAVVGLTAGMAMAVAGGAYAAEPVAPAPSVPAAPAAADNRALRRTPAVEVYRQWKNSVVFVTGPIVKGDKPTAEEFFQTPQVGPVENSVGTGFVVHADGYILTNAHAAERIVGPVVVLPDGKPRPAELLASLHELDVALLKVEGVDSLRPVQFGQSGDAMTGEAAIVIANPLGLSRTCTVGVVSATGRSTHLADVRGVTLLDLLQSDAGINPGSSGGPWFNAAGEVMGMTTSMKRDAENVAFAISTATLRKTLPAMLDAELRGGFVTGLTTATDGPCRVADVVPDSPASAIELHPDDGITKVDRIAIASVLDYHLAMIGRKPGDKIALEVLRKGQSLQGNLELAKRPNVDVAALAEKRLGLTVAALEPDKFKAMGLRTPHGVAIAKVDAPFYAKAQVPPKPGDVLARVGRIRPRNLEHLGQLLQAAKPGRPLSIVVLRREGKLGTRIDITVAVPQEKP
jgi:serine protease Do